MEMHNEYEMTLWRAKECAMCTIKKIHAQHEEHVLNDEDIDRVRDSMQILMYCHELFDSMKDKKE